MRNVPYAVLPDTHLPLGVLSGESVLPGANGVLPRIVGLPGFDCLRSRSAGARPASGVFDAGIAYSPGHDPLPAVSQRFIG